MNRVLMMAPYFLPRRRVGSMRPFRFAAHLREHGWEPVVVSIRASGELTKREAELLAGVSTIELSSPFDLSHRSESHLSRTQSRGRPARRAGRASLLEAAFPVDTWLPLLLVHFRRLEKLARDEEVDVLWATGDPWSALVVTELLARRTRLPFVADFRNPWTLCKIRRGERFAVTNAANRWLERRVVEGAAHVTFCAATTESRYREFYGPRIPASTIYNSFDRALLEPGEGTLAEPTDALHIGFFGRFRAMSPARPLVDALALGRERGTLNVGQVLVHSFGPLPTHEAELARSRGVDACFVEEAAVPLERSVQVLRRFDLLLVSTNRDRDEIVPAKLFESLAADRPILSLAPNPEVTQILERTGAGRAGAIDDPASLLTLLRECIAAKRAGSPLPIGTDRAEEVILEYEAGQTTLQLVRILDAVRRH